MSAVKKTSTAKKSPKRSRGRHRGLAGRFQPRQVCIDSHLVGFARAATEASCEHRTTHAARAMPAATMAAGVAQQKGCELPGSTATAALVVNAIPAVCAANPGVLSALDLVVAAQAASS
jgi:hypothetical protein